MPFEIPDANEAGDPVVPISWPVDTSPWPGDPALWKSMVPGLLHFLQTMRIQLEISTMRHGLFDNGAFREGNQLDVSSAVLCSTVTMSFPRQDRCDAQGYFAIPYAPTLLVDHLGSLFEDHGFPEDWQHDEEVIAGIRDTLGSLVPQVQHCVVLGQYGFPGGALFAQYHSFALRAQTLPELMVELARAAELFEHNEAPRLLQHMRDMRVEAFTRLTRWAEDHAPGEG